MPLSADERKLIDRFSRTYERLTQSDVMLAIEREVCGCDYGCTSWTTLDETRTVRNLLGLQPGRRLLEVGAGSGWPGLYLARETGCDVALLDLPLEGLKAARKRAARDNHAGACWVAQGDGTALPFADGAFDAVYHSDVLCCLVGKREVLQSCRRVVRDGGRMVFSVILIAPGLSDADYVSATAGGPTFIEAPAPYPAMIEKAGFEITDHADLTEDYADTFSKYYAQERLHRDEMDRIHGKEAAADLMARRARTLDALERNLLRRELFAVVPAS